MDDVHTLTNRLVNSGPGRHAPGNGGGRHWRLGARGRVFERAAGEGGGSEGRSRRADRVAEIALERGDCKGASESYAKAAAVGAVSLARRATEVRLPASTFRQLGSLSCVGGHWLPPVAKLTRCTP